MKKILGHLSARLAAASDQVRLRLLHLLHAHELSVGEIAQVVQLPQSTVSRHLRALADHGWIGKRTEGPAAFYRLALDDQPRENRDLWMVLRTQLDDAELQEDLQRARAVISERRTDSQAFFGAIGSDWDPLRNDLFGVRFTSIGLLGLLNPQWTVADLGCGTGNATELLAPFVRRVVAIDSSPTMLAAAKERLSTLPNIEFLESDTARIPLADASVDAAVSVLLLHHVPDIGAVLGEMRRVSREVALVIDIAEHDRDEYRRMMGHRLQGIPPMMMHELMTQAGFNSVTYHPLPHEPGSKGPGLFVATGRV